MLIEEPQWTFTSRKPLTKWYGHVQLLKDHVLGQWFRLERYSGELKWQRKMFRSSTVCGVDSGVIVASEMCSGGPWTANFGCYGISLEDGRLLWTSHRSGSWGRIVRFLDFIPGFTNQFRDTPKHVEGGKLFCCSGRVLELRTSRLIEKVSREAVESLQSPPTLAKQLYDSHIAKDHTKVPVGDNLLLCHAEAHQGFKRGQWKIAAEAEDGKLVWQLSIEQLGRHIDGNFYS